MPAEGMQVVSKALVDGLRQRGEAIEVLRPQAAALWFPKLLLRRPQKVVFTHGPGSGVVLLSALLRRLTSAQIIWVATRPDLGDVRSWLKGKPTAHAVVGNRPRADIASVSPGAQFVQQFIGIDPQRVARTNEAVDPWPEITGTGRLVALHVGHVRPNRGLDLLVAAKNALGDRVEIVVQTSPTFAHDSDLLQRLTDAGVRVRRGFVKDLSQLYNAADLYLFTASNDDAGAIELPLGVLEALACGKPVLSTTYGALPDALRGVHGVHFSSPDQFVRRLADLIDDPDGLSTRPEGLPDSLDARRVVDAVVRAGVTN
jgi:glycosyltransferase involved in cell wall biosynthesis